MTRSRFLTALLAGLLAFVPAARGLDVHLQELPPAPGLTPSEALDPLEGVREAVNCGLDFLNTAKNCGLSAPADVVSPFLVRFDPLLCRLTMRFAIGELIDGLLKQWLAGAFARLGSPAIGALCLLGIGPKYCGATETVRSTMMSPVVPQSAPAKKAAATAATPGPRRAPHEVPQAAQEGPAEPETAPPQPQLETTRHDATGLDHLAR